MLKIKGSAFAFRLNPVTSQHQWHCFTCFTFSGHRFHVYPPFRHYNLLLQRDRVYNLLFERETAFQLQRTVDVCE
jgi:hypothetical protein